MSASIRDRLLSVCEALTVELIVGAVDKEQSVCADRDTVDEDLGRTVLYTSRNVVTTGTLSVRRAL